MTSIELGLVQVYTGEGKGKTTAAVGLAVRAVGAGMGVAFVQFIKGGARSSELAVLEDLGVRVERPAVRSTGLLGGGIHDGDRAAADEAWSIAKDVIGDAGYQVVILDEINIAMHYGLVDTDDVIAVLQARFPAIEVVLTGRYAPEAILEYADLVTAMKAVKHPYDEGARARPGIEF